MLSVMAPAYFGNVNDSKRFYNIDEAISDLTVCFVSMPFTMLRLINHTSWNYGDGLCRLTRFKYQSVLY
jgi:hypothetical protein